MVADRPGPVPFATVPGAHPYGSPSRDLDVERSHGVPDGARAASALPDAPTGYDALHDLVVRTRLEG